MEGEYQRLRVIVAAPSSRRAFTIGELSPPLAAAAFGRLQLEGAPLQRADQLLLETSVAGNDPGALLCLRCRVSQALDQKLRALHRQFGCRHQLDLVDMATTVLDDQGQPLPWQAAPCDPPRRDPFPLTVLRSFQPERSSLGTWSRVLLQSQPDLVRLLRWHGLLLIRDWALLAHASPARMERAWHLHGRSGLSIRRVLELHQHFCRQYAQISGTGSGHWQPDGLFLRHLDPATSPLDLRAALLAMAQAVRRERLNHPPQQPSGLEPGDGSSGAEWQGRLQRLDACLQRALRHQLPAMLGEGRSDADLRARIWLGFAEGLSQRAIAARCGPAGSLSQASVSRKLQLEAHAATIATTAAQDLRGEQGFEDLGQSAADSERIVAGLRTYLLDPVPDDGRSRLALWLLPLLHVLPLPQDLPLTTT